MSKNLVNSIYAVGSTTVSIPAGQTNAFYVGVQPYLTQSKIKWVSGGSLLVIGTKYYGATLAGATLAASPYYIVNSVDPDIIDGPATYYLAGSGTTVTASILWGYSEGATLA